MIMMKVAKMLESDKVKYINEFETIQKEIEETFNQFKENLDYESCLLLEQLGKRCGETAFDIFVTGQQLSRFKK